MSYDGFYGDISNRATTSELLVAAQSLKEEITGLDSVVDEVSILANEARSAASLSAAASDSAASASTTATSASASAEVFRNESSSNMSMAADSAVAADASAQAALSAISSLGGFASSAQASSLSAATSATAASHSEMVAVGAASAASTSASEALSSSLAISGVLDSASASALAASGSADVASNQASISSTKAGESLLHANRAEVEANRSHSEADRARDEADRASAISGITFGTTSGTSAEGNDQRILNGQTAFSWGNHASQGYLKTAPSTTYTASTGLSLTGNAFSTKYGTAVGTSTQGNDSRVNNGQTAFSWGNHASQGYLKTFTDTTYANGSGLDLMGSTFSVKYGTAVGTSTQGNDSRVNNGQTAFSWGNHASQGYLKTFTDTTYTAGTGLSLTGNAFSTKYGTAVGTSTQGNDSRLSNSREWIAATVSQAEAEAGTSTTRRAWTAQRISQAVESKFVAMLPEVISSGSNSNGHWIAFADGTQVCHYNGFKNTKVDDPYGTLFINNVIFTFAKSFTSVPSISPGAAKWGTGASWSSVNSVSENKLALRIVDGMSRDSGDAYFSYVAVGRWY